MIIEGNRSHLYQWNTGQRLKLLTDPAGTILSLSTGGDALRREAYYDNGLVYADIPNLLLQQAGRLYVYVHRVAGDRMTTVLEATYQIRAQPKPPDYINDDPAEILIWHQVEQAVRDDAADAAKSAGAASKSAEAAVESQRLAATSAQDAKHMAEASIGGAMRAEAAQKSIVGTEGRVNTTAKQVSADALTAQTARDDALTHRQAAEGTLGEAQASAVRAENAALDADQSETAAKTAAQNAAGSEGQASQALADLLRMLGTDIATLVGGKIPMSQIPATATQEVYEIASEAELTGLVAQRADLAELIELVDGVWTVTKTWQLLGDGDAGKRENWIVWGTSYAVQSGNATTAGTAENANTINGHRLAQISQSEWDSAVKDPDTYYLVYGGGGA